MIRRFILSLLALLCISCGGNKTGGSAAILPPEKMQRLFWDIIRAEAFTTQFVKKNKTLNDVEENAGLQKKIFALHQVSREQFYESLNYYEANGNQLKPILDSMIAVAGREIPYNINPVPPVINNDPKVQTVK